MTFRSDAQRKAAMANINKGRSPIARSKTIWAHANPLKEVARAVRIVPGPRGDIAVPIGARRSPTPIRKPDRPKILAERQRIASAALTSLGLTSGFGGAGIKVRSAERRQAMKQLALVGGLGLVGTAGVGLLALKTPFGRRMAGRALRMRPLGFARRLVFEGRRQVGEAANRAVGAMFNKVRFGVNNRIDLAATKLTGVSDLPGEINILNEVHKRGMLEAGTQDARDRLLRQAMSNKGSERIFNPGQFGYGGALQAARQAAQAAQAAQESVGVPYGVIPRLDARVKRGARWLGRKLGLPITGPIGKPNRPGDPFVFNLPAGRSAKDYVASLRHDQAGWASALKTGHWQGGTVSLAKVNPNVMRRRHLSPLDRAHRQFNQRFGPQKKRQIHAQQEFYDMQRWFAQQQPIAPFSQRH